VGIQVAGCDASLGYGLQQVIRRDGAKAPPEAVGDETSVAAHGVRRNERLGAPAENQHACLHGRRGIERRPWQPPDHADLVERTPDHTVERARPRERPLDGNSPLDDEVGPEQRRQRIVEQQMEQIGRSMERQVGDHAERLARQLESRRVTLDHVNVPPASAELRRPFWVYLDCEDTLGHARQLRGQYPAAGAKIDNEILRTDAGAADELRRQGTAAKKVLATSR
jgi:hypothetical protein